MALDADPTSPTFNCYITLANANAYHATRLHNAAWTGASDADKTAALIWATRNFETLEWHGWMSVATQNLQWPRAGVFRIGGSTVNASGSELYYNMVFDSTTVPTIIQQATAEAAMWLISTDYTQSPPDAGYKRIKVDTLELEIDKNDRTKWLVDSVKNMIWRYVRGSNPYSAPVVRV